MKTLLSKLVKDEQGGEVLEYALIAGLIVVAAIAVITSVGGKVLARWTSLNGSLSRLTFTAARTPRRTRSGDPPKQRTEKLVTHAFTLKPRGLGRALVPGPGLTVLVGGIGETKKSFDTGAHEHAKRTEEPVP